MSEAKADPPSGTGGKQWEIDEVQFAQWSAGTSLPDELRQHPSSKSLIFVALERAEGRSLTYEELQAEIVRAGVVVGEPPVSGLRVAVRDLAAKLDANAYPFEIGTQAEHGKRERQIYLRRKASTDAAVAPPGILREAPELDERVFKPRRLAEQLITDRKLPFSALYHLPKAAHWWAVYDEAGAAHRARYERRSLERLGVVTTLKEGAGKDRLVNFIGLGVAGGLGEVEILESLLSEGLRVHYVAIDSSAVLLSAHAQLIEDRFEEPLRKGWLMAVCSSRSLFDLETTIQHAQSRYLQNHGDEFLPTTAPTLVSYLGNTYGNDERDQEWRIFGILQKAFPAHPIVCLLLGFAVDGASLEHGGEDRYSDTVWEFLLATPRYLLTSAKQLRSVHESGATVEDSDEFTLHADARREVGAPGRRVEVSPYVSDFGVRGHRYHFRYPLLHELRLTGTGETGPAAAAGADLLLYANIKFDPKSLRSFLEGRGLVVRPGSVEDPAFAGIMELESKGRRPYAVIAVYTRGKPAKTE